jgi:hypothetical protein
MLKSILALSVYFIFIICIKGLLNILGWDMNELDSKLLATYIYVPMATLYFILYAIYKKLTEIESKLNKDI